MKWLQFLPFYICTLYEMHAHSLGSYASGDTHLQGHACTVCAQHGHCITDTSDGTMTDDPALRSSRAVLGRQEKGSRSILTERECCPRYALKGKSKL